VWSGGNTMSALFINSSMRDPSHMVTQERYALYAQLRLGLVL